MLPPVLKNSERIIWLFSMVLGHSRMLWGRFVLHQDLQTLLRCYTAAFEALGMALARRANMMKVAMPADLQAIARAPDRRVRRGG